MRLAWCDYEFAFLKEEYPERGAQYVADKLNRTYLSVKSQAKKLNIQRSNVLYADWEIEVIKTYYPEWGVKKCSERLPNRAEMSIAKKAQDLGIKCNLIKQRQNLGLRTHDMPKGFYMGSEGYYVYTPTGKTMDRILYHRYVMEQHLGRKLRSDEIVHHKDENKLNNDISNLEITNRADHARHHHGNKEAI
jgi:hypothetical protein